jgi:uncharacterized protein YjbI with pentapeptide repeats
VPRVPRTVREVRFRTERNVDRLPEPASHQLGGPEPSAIITPAQFVAELDRLMPLVVWTPDHLAPAAWRTGWGHNARVMTCLVELGKFIPANADHIPDAALDAAGRADRAARPERYARAWLDDERARIAALIESYRFHKDRIFAAEAAAAPKLEPRGELNARAVHLHKQWLDRGRTGDGRLDIAHLDQSKRKIGFADLSHGRLDHVDFTGSNLAFARFDRAELTDVIGIQANFADCSFAGARLVRCDFLGANLALVRLEEAVVGGGRWDRCQLDRALIRRAKLDGVSLRGAELGNAALDGAVFTDCDLRDVSFALRAKDLLGTTTHARFERCDLRNTQWADRLLEHATFLDCKMHGISGAPGRTVGIRIERPDLSPNGDGRTIGRDADVLALWRGEAVDLD